MFWKSRASFSHIIAGLGNPGREYEGSLHNAGFRVVNKISLRTGDGKTRKRGSYLYAETSSSSKRIVFIQPLTFMNLSGRAVSEAMRWYRLAPENLTVIYDDMDLEPGTIRIRGRGSSGGHKGLASVIENLGTNEVIRLRVGIGRPSEKESVKSYVLRKPGVEKDLISMAEERAAEAVIYMISEGLEAAMNKYNVLP